MYRKTIECESFFEGIQKKDYYFNLTKAECTELQFGELEGLDSRMAAAIREDNKGELLAIIKKLILASYGERRDNQFVKSTEISETFSHTEAFSVLLEELANNGDEANKFFKGIIPKDVAEKAAELEKDPKVLEELLNK